MNNFNIDMATARRNQIQQTNSIGKHNITNKRVLLKESDYDHALWKCCYSMYKERISLEKKTQENVERVRNNVRKLTGTLKERVLRSLMAFFQETNLQLENYAQLIVKGCHSSKNGISACGPNSIARVCTNTGYELKVSEGIVRCIRMRKITIWKGKKERWRGSEKSRMKGTIRREREWSLDAVFPFLISSQPYAEDLLLSSQCHRVIGEGKTSK